MECNKEEATRAKEIAEKKMQIKDFAGAQKIALKAQQLYPDLENISQMIMVCDVHCSAENKVFGNEKDWYGILKVEHTADEALIKKQYKKFALLLHPDKNKFTGAADAFKLIGEAQRVLLDSEKRRIHDSKRRASRPSVPNRAPQQTNKNSNVGNPPWVQGNIWRNTTFQFSGSNPQYQPQKQTQTTTSNKQETFWTVCPFCSVRYQYYRDVVNKLLQCQSCKRCFTGYEIKDQAIQSETNHGQSAFPKQEKVPNHSTSNVKPGSAFWNSTSKVEPYRHAGNQNQTMAAGLRRGGNNQVGGEYKAKRKGLNVDMNNKKEGGAEESKSSGNVNGKKRKQVAESSESCNTGTSSDSEENFEIDLDGNHLPKQSFGGYERQSLRRSTRSKQHVSYNENVSDDEDFESPLKRAEVRGSFQEQQSEDLMSAEIPEIKKPVDSAAVVRENAREMKEKEVASHAEDLQNRKEQSMKTSKEVQASEDEYKRSFEANGKRSLNSNPDERDDQKVYECPDPDFSDFDRDRKVECFATGQIWACYDNLGAMPRFYARIVRVFSPGFKVRITWLEPDPDDEDKVKWINQELPVSCGMFKRGRSENTEDLPMFSHLVHWQKGSGRDMYKIYPRKGETWALFKKWDIKWPSDPESKEKFEFEFVEVLSDYDEAVGVFVAHLGKVKGFTCLFCHTTKGGVNSFQLPPNELYRFSHMVPCFQMSGDERKDVPKGSFELDPACLPANLEEIDVPESLNSETAGNHSNVSCSEAPINMAEQMAGSVQNTCTFQVDTSTDVDPEKVNLSSCPVDSADSPSTKPVTYDIPEPEFYDFDADKSEENFQIGQIWALYGEEDGLPKYYARIKKIYRRPNFTLHVDWLASYPQANKMIRWVDKDMLTCCGLFEVEKDSTEKYTSTTFFSHQLGVDVPGRDLYAIMPRKGQVWALFRNWNPGLTCSDVANCEYDLVEILEESDLEIKAVVLEKVNGFKSVFKAQLRGGSTVTLKIPCMEMLRFSYQVPAFRLTQERGCSLRGFWELDPAALPPYLLRNGA